MSTSLNENVITVEKNNQQQLFKFGWECPKCGAVMSPTTSVCVNCRGNHYNISNEKDLQEELKKYLNYIHTGDYPEAYYETDSTSSRK